MKTLKPKFYSIEQLKLLFSRSSSATIYNWMNSGKLPYRQVGKDRLVLEEDLTKFLENCKPATHSHSRSAR